MIEIAQKKIKIKGYQDGLLITANLQDWTTFREEIISHISDQGNFFKGARVAIDAGNLDIHAAELGQLRDILSERGISLWAVVSTSRVTVNTAEMLGLETCIDRKQMKHTAEVAEPPVDAVFIQRTLRSGMSIISEKSIVVIGDVNPGAEVISGKNILIWGRLKGAAYAGKGGGQDHIICALSMAPTLLRIGDIILELPTKFKKSRPYTAKILDGVIHIEPWD